MQFIDLQAQQARIRSQIDHAIARVLDHGSYIMGPEVAELEAELSLFCGAAHTISCASGTDALMLALMARGVGPGDAVFLPSFTFAATAETVALVGAVPIFVDIDEETYCLDPARLADAIAGIPSDLRPVGVIAVDLFGLPADYPALHDVANASALWVMADAAQSFGATQDGASVGALTSMGTTSFFPAKPLGCYGDGGAVFCTDAAEAATLRSLRVHGSGSDKYDNVRIGINGRLDTIQAAILLEKLLVFPSELEARSRVADRYNEALQGFVRTPTTPKDCTSAWAQYTIRVADRAAFQASLSAEGIPTAVYYPRPLHQQSAYAGFPLGEGGLPVSERLALEVLSLPMHPYLGTEDQDRIIAAVRSTAAAAGTT